jgi:RNA polymerase sigma-70 factor (ECF subfamily)
MRADPSIAQEETPTENPAGPGRPETIERLFREHNEALIRFLLPRVRSRQAALEVAQEAYVRLLSLDRPGAVSYLRSFLFKTAANLAIDWARRNDVHTRAMNTPLFREFTDNRTPERAAVGAQEVKRLGELLMGLPPKCREAFVLNRFQGLDFPAIASKMNLSERMVRTYVMRALLHCRANLEPRDGGYE